MTLTAALAPPVVTCTKELAVVTAPLSSRTHGQQVGRVSPIGMNFQIVADTISKYTRRLQ